MKVAIHNANDLKEAIETLKAREIAEKRALHENFSIFTESLKPANLLRSTVRKVVSSPTIKQDVFKTALGIGVGLLTRRIFRVKKGGLVKKLAVNAARIGVTGLVSKNSTKLKHTGLKLLAGMFGKKK